MKWYWCVALTVAIVAIFAFVRMPTSLTVTIIALFAVWVAADSSSFGWGISVLFLWPIAFPWYLITRPKSVSSEEQARENKLHMAFKLDQRGDWSESIALYEQIANESVGKDHEYALTCAKQIREKMSVGE